MTQVLQLRLSESVMLDHGQLGTLYAQLGTASAEDVVCRAIEELANRMSECERFYRMRQLAELRKHARSLIAISEQLGMHALGDAARSVTECIDNADHVALAATLSRMLRIGDQSLTAVWDQSDLIV